ncbi:MAG: DUF4301 family protein [Deltaproteobacteria bacterium]|nr:DUF4301 family protein [Deltaproteobacteria bacterium]
MDSRFLDDLLHETKQIGLRPDRLKTHFKRFSSFAQRGWKNHTFVIKASCKVTNQRILSYKSISLLPQGNDFSGIASFIPAAGSSTRFINPLFEAFSGGRHPNLLADWILPPGFEKHSDLGSLAKLLRTPKALFPCVREGMTFLELKCREHKAIQGLDSLIFVSPWKYSDRFQKHAQETMAAAGTALSCLEQGPDLSTVRVNKQGHPVKGEQDQVSPVPSGHGALLELFPRVRKLFPSTEALFIRNIDNMVGCGEEPMKVTRTFLSFYKLLLRNVQGIRDAIRRGLMGMASSLVAELVEQLPQRDLTPQENIALEDFDMESRPLVSLLLTLFQTPLGLLKRDSLPSLYARPLNLLGQVPNSGKDKGGTPVIIESSVGDLAICLELPHMNETERDDFFSDPAKATHFNPVFAVVEAVDDLTTYRLDEHPYWIFAEKAWRGSKVYYHESLLYELIGNSEMANLVFCEVPRSVFNPNKSLDDTKEKKLADWL